MPSTATITGFHTFDADTKARANRVNFNFSTFRGHSLPIEPLTATSSNLTYDIGSSDYRWRVGYFGRVNSIITTTITGASGNFETSSVGWQTVTNLSLTITVAANAVELMLVPDGATLCSVGVRSTTSKLLESRFRLIRDTTTSIVDGEHYLQNAVSTISTNSIRIPPSSFKWTDVPGAGTYVYSFQCNPVNTDQTTGVLNVKLKAREL